MLNEHTYQKTLAQEYPELVLYGDNIEKVLLEISREPLSHTSFLAKNTAKDASSEYILGRQYSTSFGKVTMYFLPLGGGVTRTPNAQLRLRSQGIQVDITPDENHIKEITTLLARLPHADLSKGTKRVMNTPKDSSDKDVYVFKDVFF